MSIGILLIAWGPIMLLNIIPDAWKQAISRRVGEAASNVAWQQALIPAIVALVLLLVAIDAVLLFVARRRFRRDRLIAGKA